MTIFEYKFYFIFNLKIQSNNLGIFRLNDNRLLRLNLMNHLHILGWDNREITDFLNISNIKKIRTNAVIIFFIIIFLYKIDLSFLQHN